MDGEEKEVYVQHTDIHARGFRKLVPGEDVEFKFGTNPKTGKLAAVEVTGPAGDYVGRRVWLSLDDVELDGSLKKGKCVFWNSEKGFGGIAVDGEEKDVYVQQTELHARGFRKLVPGE